MNAVNFIISRNFNKYYDEFTMNTYVETVNRIVFDVSECRYGQSV